MPIPYIPAELVEMIIDHSANSRHALHSWSLVAKAWRSRALSYIFRSIEVRGRRSRMKLDGVWISSDANSFAHFLISVPHLTIYMRQIAFIVDSMRRYDFEHLLLIILDTQFAVPFEWNVERLVIDGFGTLDSTFLRITANALPAGFPSLQRLDLIQDTHSHLQRHIIKLAASVPNLRELRIIAGDSGSATSSGRPRNVHTLAHRFRFRRLTTVRFVVGSGNAVDLPDFVAELKRRACKVTRIEVSTALRQQELFLSLPRDAGEWINELRLKMDPWLDNDFFLGALGSCSRVRRLSLSWQPSTSAASIEFPDLPDLTRLEILEMKLPVTEHLELGMMPVQQGWERLDSGLASCSVFRQLRHTVIVDRGWELKVERHLAGSLPRLYNVRKVQVLTVHCPPTTVHSVVLKGEHKLQDLCTKTDYEGCTPG